MTESDVGDIFHISRVQVLCVWGYSHRRTKKGEQSFGVAYTGKVQRFEFKFKQKHAGSKLYFKSEPLEVPQLRGYKFSST